MGLRVRVAVAVGVRGSGTCRRIIEEGGGEGGRARLCGMDATLSEFFRQFFLLLPCHPSRTRADFFSLLSHPFYSSRPRSSLLMLLLAVEVRWSWEGDRAREGVGWVGIGEGREGGWTLVGVERLGGRKF